LRSLEFDSSAFEDLAWWIGQDRTQALRIVRLVREVQREPFSGMGKPEPLKHELSGCWSRRIDQEHRLVYQVLPDKKSAFFPAASTINSELLVQLSQWLLLQTGGPVEDHGKRDGAAGARLGDQQKALAVRRKVPARG